jgi:hypothetical protein
MAQKFKIRRVCPQCSAQFETSSGRKVFCTPAHKEAFFAINRARGVTLLPFVQVWRYGKSGRTEDTAYAFQQMAKLADKWNAEDRAAGRKPDMIVSSKRKDLWSAVDLA